MGGKLKIFKLFSIPRTRWRGIEEQTMAKGSMYDKSSKGK